MGRADRVQCQLGGTENLFRYVPDESCRIFFLTILQDIEPGAVSSKRKSFTPADEGKGFFEES